MTEQSEVFRMGTSLCRAEFKLITDATISGVMNALCYMYGACLMLGSERIHIDIKRGRHTDDEEKNIKG